MQIIIVGCGKVGYTIAKHLVDDRHNVVMIDKKDASFSKISESLDVMVIRGNGLSGKTLQEANVRECDLVVSVTNSDETNILCCMTAKRFGAKYAVARVRDPEYVSDLADLKQELGIDIIINPELQAALDISRLLRFPSVREIDTFVGGRVELFYFELKKFDLLVGKTIQQGFSKLQSTVLVVTLKRGEITIIPHGDFKLREGDTLGIMGRPSDLTAFFREVGRSAGRIRDVLVIGGGKISFYLIASLLRNKIGLKVIEIDYDICERLSGAYPQIVVVNADGTDEGVLVSESMDDADAIVCLTDRDEENVIIGLFAKSRKMMKTIVKVNHINENLVRSLGIGTIVNPKDSAANQITRYARGLSNSADKVMTTVYRLLETETEVVEVLEFYVARKLMCTHVKLKALKFKEGILVGCIVRSDKIIIPNGNSEILEGDTVIVVSRNEEIYDLEDICIYQ